MIELTTPADKTELERSISREWPAEPHYRGKAVFESIYGHGEGFSGPTGNGIEAAVRETGLLPRDYQECYLGYLPSKDAFILGFDVWQNDSDDGFWRDDDYGTDGVFFVKVHADGSMGKVSAVPNMECECFYTSNYKALRATYPDLIDLRLD